MKGANSEAVDDAARLHARPVPHAAGTRSLRPHSRWIVLALLFGSTVLNYVDRQTLSILARTVQDDLGLTDRDYAGVVQAFLIAYTLAYLIVGRLTDRVGVKWSLALFVGWWSIANAVTGFARGLGELWAARFALGLGEAGNYTAGPKAIGQQFEPRQRALAYGIYTAGAMVGATIAPPVIGWLSITYGWRAAFISTGSLGLAWLVCWLAFYCEPDAQLAGDTTPAGTPESEGGVWAAILRDRSVWALVFARMVTDPLWYFYLFWFPKYLGDERGFGLVAVASTAWIVYLAADIGSLGGGWLSDRLVKRGMRPREARLRIMRIAAIIIPIGGL
ncbi:MFS transporter, partial [Sphingomonas sp. CCH15-F11]|uniref:MFS transporter n=1 Tax=Sphingomonas sp. CCH15-F11 TaxID=1768785 RepID=UPI0008332A5F